MRQSSVISKQLSTTQTNEQLPDQFMRLPKLKLSTVTTMRLCILLKERSIWISMRKSFANSKFLQKE